MDSALDAFDAGQHRERVHRRFHQVRKPVNQMRTCLCRKVPAGHEAQSQAEASRSDVSCERDVSTHGGVTTPSFGGVRTQMTK